MQWWTPATNVPLVAYDVSVFNVLVDSLKITLGAISGKGLILLGVCISVVLISSIFRALLFDQLHLLEAVRCREFKRRVNGEDIRRNLDTIVDDKVSSMEVSFLAKARFRFRHPNADLNEKIYQRELSYQADVAFRERNPDAKVENRDLHRHLVSEYYRKRGRGKR